MKDSTSRAKTLSMKEPSGEDDHGEDGHGMEDERVELDVEDAELEGYRGDVAVRRLVDDKRLVGGDFRGLNTL